LAVSGNALLRKATRDNSSSRCVDCIRVRDALDSRKHPTVAKHTNHTQLQTCSLTAEALCRCEPAALLSLLYIGER
jgi:hypothetical protein